MDPYGGGRLGMKLPTDDHNAFFLVRYADQFLCYGKMVGSNRV